MAELSDSEDEGGAQVAPAAERIRSVRRAASRWREWRGRRQETDSTNRFL